MPSAPSNIPQALALGRFGFGASAADLEAGARAPKAWLLAQLEDVARDTALFEACFSALPGSDATTAIFPSMLRRAGLFGRAGAQVGSPGNGRSRIDMATGNGRDGRTADARPAGARGQSRVEQRLMPYLHAELGARMRYAHATPAPLHERLVWFWSNHFTVSAKRIGLYALVGPYEREAIRPHVLGRFEDLLRAAVRHPAMQIYLDNWRSVGPRSAAVGSGRGQMRRTGVNENLAREILELHTLGARDAYDQGDIAEFALALTGWGLSPLAGGFAFDASAHEPGDRRLLGVRYPQPGIEQADAMLASLSAHPATARHLARKLLEHFTPQPVHARDIEHLAQTYLRSQGDLSSVYRALLDLDAAWDAASPGRARRPDEFVVAAWRSLGVGPPAGEHIHSQLAALGQSPWFAPSPDGWSDRSADWLGPDALLARIEWSARLGERHGTSIDARALADRMFGDRLAPASRREIARAESGAQALALLLTSPEFLHT